MYDGDNMYIEHVVTAATHKEMYNNFAFQTSTVRIVLSHPNLHLRVYL